MKKTQEIIGLPIISISDGMEIGKAKNVIINADKGTVDYIVVDSGMHVLSVRVIPTGNVLGIGEYALTIENEGAINDIGKVPSAIDLIQKNIQVRGTKVLTKKGSLIGEIGDIFVDDNQNCRIVGLEYIADITQRKVRIIPRESVITFGKNLTVVKDDVEGSLVDRPAQLNEGSANIEYEVEKKNLVNFEPENWNGSVDKADELIASSGDALYGEISAKSEESQDIIDTSSTFEFEVVEAQESSPVQAPVEENNAASLFEQRQRQYLNGRIATKTITDNFGNVIIDEGMLITDSVIDEAKSKGKLIELVMNNKA